MKTSYEAALKRERDRERQHRHTKQGSFDASHISVDALVGPDGEPVPAAESVFFSDQGAGAAAIRSFDEPPEEIFRKKVDSSRHRVLRHYPPAIANLMGILRNGNDKKKTVCENIIDEFVKKHKLDKHSKTRLRRFIFGTSRRAGENTTVTEPKSAPFGDSI